MNSIACTRIGKIARLPHRLREQVNCLLRDNQPAKAVLSWLNSLPEVTSVLDVQFGSRPITKQNLSQWKAGGFRDWLARKEALELDWTNLLSDTVQPPVKPSQTQSSLIRPHPAKK